MHAAAAGLRGRGLREGGGRVFRQTESAIVEEKSILRQLVRSATEIAELGYEGSEDVSDIIDSAEKKILDISNRKKDTDFVPINNIVMDSFKDLEALMNNKNGLTGLPTGFVDFDNL